MSSPDAIMFGMTLEQLRVFVAVAERQRMTRATEIFAPHAIRRQRRRGGP